MSFRVEKNVMVPMRDGTKLATDLWIPDGETPGPVLLVRLPYSKDAYPAAEIDYATGPNIFLLLEQGYAIVYQDCRGTGMSEGDFEPVVNEADDGVDTIAWLCQQAWCDGSIGTFGHSYLGITQWASASRAPEALKAIVPSVSTTDTYSFPWYSRGGALSWHALWFWTQLMAMYPTNAASQSPRGAWGVMSEALEMAEKTKQHLEHLPIIDQPLYQELWPWWNRIVSHSTRDTYWQRQSAIERIESVTAPALHIAGWFDLFGPDSTRAFRAARASAATETARSGQRLIIGPWDHAFALGEYHDRQFGAASSVYAADLTQAHLDFFDRHVRGRADAPELAPVRIFVMGLNQWREEQDWPLPDTDYVDHYLGGTSANSLSGGGTLGGEPGADPITDTFTYDPNDPVPTLGGRIMLPASRNQTGPVDQRPVQARDDVLVYSTEPLRETVEVTGEIEAVLYVSSSTRDTDFTAKLVDVAPDGTATYLTDGILRMRYREALDAPVPMEPGTVYEARIDMGITSNAFLPGHRIRVEISSSNFPRYDRNPNTGEDIATATTLAIATNVVHRGPEWRSRVILPVIRRDATPPV
jgi:putative CocE/NonD family hydrolase